MPDYKYVIIKCKNMRGEISWRVFFEDRLQRIFPRKKDAIAWILAQEAK